MDFLLKYRVGSGVEKSFDTTTHHDGGMNYYMIPPRVWSELFNRQFHQWESGNPYTLNEHANPTKARLFLDLDCNKPGAPRFSHCHLLQLIAQLQRLVRRKYDRDSTNIIQQAVGAGAETPFDWAGCGTDTTARFQEHLLLVSARILSPDPIMYRYHLVWPFITTTTHQMQRFFKEFFQDSQDGRELAGRAAPDLQLYNISSLRTLFSLKEAGSGDGSYQPLAAFDSLGHELGESEFNHTYLAHIVGEPGPRFRELRSIAWLKACSLLFGRPLERPSEPEPTVTVAQDEPVITPRQRFMTVREEFSPQPLRAQLLAALEGAHEGTDLRELATSVVVPYINRFVAMITDMTGVMMVTKYTEPGERFPGFVFRNPVSLEMFLKPCEIHYKAPWQQKVMRYDPYKLWVASPDRLTFRKIQLGDPALVPEECLNVWRGPRIVDILAQNSRNSSIIGPKTGKVISNQTVLDHIFTVFCGGNTEYYTYLMHWLAHVVQRPFERTKISILVQSHEGVGKDIIFAETLTAILGKQHCLVTARPDDIMGRFNTGIEGKILLVFDEAQGVAEGQSAVLKALITDPALRIERKGIDTYTQQNFLNIIICTNDLTRNVLPVGPQARRFFALECNSAINTQKDYFYDLVYWLGYDHVMTGDKYEKGVNALADFLYNMDLSDFVPTKVPVTEALVQQKLTSLPPVHAWWYDCLCQSNFMGTPESRTGAVHPRWSHESVPMIKMQLYEAYASWAKDRGYRTAHVSQFWKLMKQVGLYQRARLVALGGLRGIDLPDLASCRLAWVQLYTGTTFEDTVPTGDRITHYTAPVVTFLTAPDVSHFLFSPI